VLVLDVHDPCSFVATVQAPEPEAAVQLAARPARTGQRDRRPIGQVLQPLTRKQGHEISDKRWDYDCDLLLQTLAEALGMRPLRSSRQEDVDPGEGISVGRGLTITKSRVGDIVGVKLSSGEDVTPSGRIDVARGARIQDAEVGDIAGLKTQGKKKRRKDSR